MKQIFDWLREQSFGNVKLNGNSFAEIYRIIDEAEAKWEKDCCEWRRLKGYDNCIGEHNCEVFLIERYMLKQFNYCPFCGKRIKISEVE